MFELATLISLRARQQPHETAFVFEDERFTYAQFAQRVARAANMLRALHVRKGDRVATVTANCREQMEIYWACPSIGAVLVPLSPLLQPAGLGSLLADARPACVIVQAALLPALQEALAQCGLRDIQVVVVGEAQGHPGYETLTAVASTSLTPEHCDADDLYNIMYTSGTTGLPKGIMHTHRVRSMYALLMGNALRISCASVVVHSGSVVFNGAFVTMLPAFHSGGRYVLLRQFDAQRLVDMVVRERGTHIAVVPSQLVAILSLPNFDWRRLSSLECIMSVGAPLLRAHKDRINELLPGRLCELYGLTEGFATLLDRSDAGRKADSVGVPLAFSRMRIVRDDGTDCLPGEVGEIAGRSPILMSGYYNRDDLTAVAIRDGWLYSGDMGYADAEGFLHLVDRRKDMIDSGGVKIYPKDIEEVVSQHPAVRDVAVFGAPDDKWGETPVAAVLLKEAAAITPEQLREWINERVAARYQRVSNVVIMEEFPRSVAGKTLKRELREPYWKNSGRSI